MNLCRVYLLSDYKNQPASKVVPICKQRSLVRSRPTAKRASHRASNCGRPNVNVGESLERKPTPPARAKTHRRLTSPRIPPHVQRQADPRPIRILITTRNDGRGSPRKTPPVRPIRTIRFSRSSRREG